VTGEGRPPEGGDREAEPGQGRIHPLLSRLPALVGVLGIALALLIASLLASEWIESRLARSEATGQGSRETEAPLLEMAEDMRDVLLFFPRRDKTLLGAEPARIFDLDSPSARGKLILERLAQGPEVEDLAPALPQGVQVRELWISPSGSAYVDFSVEIGRDHPGGTTAELHTVYAVVNSLVYNLHEVRRVQILIEGREVDTLSGHLALWLPLGADLSLVDARPPGAEEEAAPSPTLTSRNQARSEERK